ncbi:MAG: hypothetical protein IPL92_11380 [Saprospiraceae bacterium]|nr:hypothetical protein [Candidatus Opimibacter iunctus]
MKKVKKIAIWVLIILVAVGSFMFYWHYFNTYSEGNRAGILQKFSKKGSIFKTYEGELIMSSIATTGNTTIASEKFFFSVNDEKVANELFNLEGKHVTLEYEQKRGHLPWSGDTDYFVTRIVAKE